jgi:sigma-B regulation protein RsbU (phosphoserine phosphatase)
MQILAVDDEPSTILLLRAALERQGHSVVTSSDGQSAFDSLKKNPVQVLITDWSMPMIEGPDLVRMARALARESYLYIILLTSLSSRDHFLAGMQAGADDFMRKPIDFEELAARLAVAERILRLHTHVARLEGLLSICSYCKKIREESGSWIRVENYMERRSDLTFSHGVCPDCKREVLKRM